MFVLKTVLFAAALSSVYSQGPQGPTTTPVPILKQINRQNDDGSYSYGYEAADGSFKIETKYPNGDVAGKYGYIDADGKQREISYGATSKRGFEPEGAGIVVPPPFINDNVPNALTEGQEDDGQYREDPKIYEDPKYNGRAQSRPSSSFRQFHKSAQPEPRYQAQNQQYQIETPVQSPVRNYQPQPAQFRSTPTLPQQPSLYSQSNILNQAPQQFSQDYVRPQSQVYHQQPQFSFSSFTPQYNQFQNQQYQNQQYQNPQFQNQQYQNYQQNPYENFNPFLGHPAQNFDPNTGSYSINFTG